MTEEQLIILGNCYSGLKEYGFDRNIVMKAVDKIRRDRIKNGHHLSSVNRLCDMMLNICDFADELKEEQNERQD